MTKGPKSERIPIPTHIEHLQTMWSLAKSCVPIDPACCFCDRGSDVAALRTCAVCMQTSHGECEDPSGIVTCFHSFEPELLTDMFGHFNMCHLCLSCFGGLQRAGSELQASAFDTFLNCSSLSKALIGPVSDILSEISTYRSWRDCGATVCLLIYEVKRLVVSIMSCLICQIVGCPVCVLLHCCVGCIVV